MAKQGGSCGLVCGPLLKNAGKAGPLARKKKKSLCVELVVASWTERKCFPFPFIFIHSNTAHFRFSFT